jgi:hypothetical protein
LICNIGPTSIQPPINTAGPDCTDVGCNFGTPLPIPNPAIPSISTCVLHTWSPPASGTLDLSTGTSSTNAPLASDIYPHRQTWPSRARGAPPPARRASPETFLPLLTSGTVRLLDHGQLRHELCGLERRAGRSGKEAVSHRVGGHDDAAASVAGACVLAASQATDDGPVLAANLAPERRGRLLDEREFELLRRGDY